MKEIGDEYFLASLIIIKVYFERQRAYQKVF